MKQREDIKHSISTQKKQHKMGGGDFSRYVKMKKCTAINRHLQDLGRDIDIIQGKNSEVPMAFLMVN